MLKQSDPLDLAFHAMADRTRRAILTRLAQGPVTLSALASPLEMSLPAVMQHLGVLEKAGLVSSSKQGRVRTCQLQPEALGLAEQWISQRRSELEHKLDRLGAYLHTLEAPSTTPTQHQGAPHDSKP